MSIEVTFEYHIYKTAYAELHLFNSLIFTYLERPALAIKLITLGDA